MWNREDLSLAELQLFEDAAFSLIDIIREGITVPGDTRRYEKCLHTGVEPFDALESEQQLFLVNQVTGILLNVNSVVPTPAAYLDATVAAVFSWMDSLVSMEIDSEYDTRKAEKHDTDQRQAVLTALLSDEEEQRNPVGRPDAECSVKETWEEVIQTLRDRVLQDEDWALAESTLDLPPDTAGDLKQNMGIDADYFSAVPPSVNFDQACTAWVEFVGRARGTRPARWRFGNTGGLLFVTLNDVVEHMEMQSQEMSIYLEKSTGEFHFIERCIFDHLESGEKDEDFPGNTPAEVVGEIRELFTEQQSGNMLALPSQFEVHEWSIIKDFAGSVGDESVRDELFDAIHDKGVFRRFRSAIDRLGISESWEKYHRVAIKKIAAKWLEENEIPWELDDDVSEL